jgi:predicted amidohydrolase
VTRFVLDLCQFDSVLADVPANARRLAAYAARSNATLLVTPELSLTGYDLGDAAAELARPVSIGEPLPGTEPIATVAPAVVVGLPELDRSGIVYNTLVVLEGGTVRFRHRKVYLPTYGMFDEGRFFGRGQEIEPFTIGGWRIGFLVCEDFWHPGLVYVLAASHIDLLVVTASSPGRGGPADSDAMRFASMDVWERIARTTAQLYGMHVALVNRCGVEGAVTYGGGSLVAGPDGEIVARAPAFEEACLTVELARDVVFEARRPFAHARDEDVRLMRELLDRLDA